MYGQTHRAGRSNAYVQDAATSVSPSSRPYRSPGADASLSPSARPQFAAARSATTPSMMTNSSHTVAMPPPIKTMPNLVHGRLHRRGGSGSGTITEPATPNNNEREPFPDLGAPVVASPSSKVKPYLRKLSSPREDQGRLDLSRSIADNDKLAGLGIQISKDAFVPPGRHTRTTSTGSQMSTHSTTSKPNQPFVHPMRQAPRPYTPPTVRSNAIDDDEDDDFVDEDHRPQYSFRGKRSMSSSSVPHGAPTPLSQTISITDLGAIPKLTSASQSNLSIISSKSSRAAGSRRNTGRSEAATTLSSRTSLDKVSVIGGRRSDTDTRTRDERIRAARRKFEEKEADKDRRAERDAQKKREAEVARDVKRIERHRTKSDASDGGRPQRPSTGGLRAGSALGKYSFRASDERPSPPIVSTPNFSEKEPVQNADAKPSLGFFAKLFNCGGRRR